MFDAMIAVLIRWEWTCILVELLVGDLCSDKLELHAREISEIVNDTKDLLLILSNGLRLSLVMLKRKSLQLLS